MTLVDFRNVSILRNFIFSLKTLKVHLSLTHVFSTSKKSILKRLLLFVLPAQKLEYGVWITDELSAEYFHWFTDALTRLKAIEYGLPRTTINNDEIQLPCIILPLAYQNKEYINSSIELLGYKPFYYNPKKRLHVDRLISCTHTAPMGNYNSSVIKDLSNSLTKCINTVEVEKKIYISRSKATKRKIINEAEVIELLLAHSYEIHNFEDYKFLQQLEIMRSVKCLIGLHGAGLTNMLFMPQGGSIVELRNEGDSHNNCYFSLSSSLNQNYFYLTNKGDRKDTNSVNITVDLLELRTLLEQIP